MSGYLGSNGTNNGIIGSTLYWTTNGMLPSGGSWYTPGESMGATSGGAYSKTINIPSNCSTIWAVTYCSFSYNSTNTGYISQSVKYYTAPGNPGTPVINYTKSRLTIKEPWTFSWTAASAGNTSSPVAGYRLRLYKNNILIPIKDSEGNTLSSSWSNDYWYDTDNTNCSCTIDPIIHGYAPGDTVKLTIFAYIKTGNNEKWWSGQGSTPASSIEYLVQNAGVMRPLVNGKHVEGVVLVALPDNSDKGYTWTEADVVKVYTPNKTWAEAE